MKQCIRLRKRMPSGRSPRSKNLPAAESSLSSDWLSVSANTLAGLTPHGHVCESSDLLTFAIAVVEEFIVRNSGGCNRSAGVSFSQGWVSDQVTTDDDAIDVHSNM
jgi:hypothetical protein